MTDDKGKEAAVVVDTTTWIAEANSSYTRTAIYLYRWSNGKPGLIDQIDTGVDAITFRKRRMIISDGSGGPVNSYRVNKAGALVRLP
jgi:hypothetical protein